jgi:hypothetical protein
MSLSTEIFLLLEITNYGMNIDTVDKTKHSCRQIMKNLTGNVSTNLSAKSVIKDYAHNYLLAHSKGIVILY